VNALQNENDHLRAAIKFGQDKPPGTASSDPGTNSFMHGELMTHPKKDALEMSVNWPYFGLILTF
jgi:hypothetical protein